MNETFNERYIKFQQGLTELRQSVYSNIEFQGNNYANDPVMWGRFHHQRVSCRSDFKETRRVEFLFKSYNSLTFAWQKLLRDGIAFDFTIV